MNVRYSITRKPRPAFTLVELLVVIGIIAALAALILVGGQRALVAAKKAAIHAEITQLDSAFLEYTNDVSGGAYPPNLLTSQAASGNSSNPTRNMTTQEKSAVASNFKRHFNKAFPKHRESSELLAAIVGAGPTSGPNLPGGLSPYEATVFWLGGFSDDPKFPISGPGGPSFDASPSGGEDFASRQPIFDFDVSRLGPRDESTQAFSGRYFPYKVDLNGDRDTNDAGESRQINFWVYFPKDRTVPYAYFQATKNPKFDPSHDGIVGIKQLKLNPKNPATIGDLRYANEGKCQILSAGLDDTWGNLAVLMGVDYADGSSTAASPILLYPNGPFTAEIADTITNFSTKTTLEDSQP